MARVASDRWDFRVEPRADDLVRQAAEATNRSLTEFVVGAAVLEAERVLADRTVFSLGPRQWAKLQQLLDRPPQEQPGLARLFSKPSVFE